MLHVFVFIVTQWVFTTVSLANLLWFFLLGSGPVGCLLCCLSNGKTQIWLGDLRLALFLFVGVLVVFWLRFAKLHATTGVHVAVFLPTASSHVRTEP